MMPEPTPPLDLDAIERRAREAARDCTKPGGWKNAAVYVAERDVPALVARVRGLEAEGCPYCTLNAELAAKVAALEAEVARLQARVGAAVPPVQRPTQAHAYWRTHRTGPNRGDKPCRRCSTLMRDVPGNKQYCSPACQQADAKDGYGRGPYGPWP